MQNSIPELHEMMLIHGTRQPGDVDIVEVEVQASEELQGHLCRTQHASNRSHLQLNVQGHVLFALFVVLAFLSTDP